MPLAEPNSLPDIFSSWEDWKRTYAEYLAEYRASQMTPTYDIRLKNRLTRLGFTGHLLDAEIAYVKNGGC